MKTRSLKSRLVLGTLLIALVSTARAASAPAPQPYSAGRLQTYIVLYKTLSVSVDAASVIARAGGSLVYGYGKIGVVLARSDNLYFRANLMKDKRIESATATTNFATSLDADLSAEGADPLPDSTPASDTDSLSPLQWNMRQIHTPEAHAITGGSPSILVGVLDTGLDYTHPDLAPNVDLANSVSCVSGAPVPGAVAANDDNGHGTHLAGTIAAASNGIGIVGVAPNVRIAGIKVGNAAGFFYPEAVVCGLMWVGSHQFHVANNGYFVDPWLYNCRNDAEQRAIWKAVRRAVGYAISQGVVMVGATGNHADDLAHPTTDATSPDDTNPVLREIHNQCSVIPVEIPGVIGVAANGNLQLKSYYSNYGLGTVDLIAPGGDSILQVTTEASNGRVLSTWPAALAANCARRVTDASGALYCYQQGTTIAAPHVAGVAALIMSQGTLNPGGVAARLQSTADPLACPTDLSIYDFFPSANSGAAQVCQGNVNYNSFNGHGQVNALTAVSP